jgi:hypothetical protein
MNPYSPEDYRARRVTSAGDALLLALDAAVLHTQGALDGLTEKEYGWEPLTNEEQRADLFLPAATKRAWRVYRGDRGWTYDYTPEPLEPPPFTTIAWIMCHIASTADMYLYCVLSGKPEGMGRSWDDLPVPATRQAMTGYIFKALADARDYLISMPGQQVAAELNKPTPAPWGEARPTYLNLWGGIIEHTLQHAMQIAVRRERIRYGY